MNKAKNVPIKSTPNVTSKAEPSLESASLDEQSVRESRLSQIRRQGPVNPNNKLYQKSQKSIRRALCHNKAKRRIGLKAKKVLQEAKISAPAFYTHAGNVDDAWVIYETDLEREFIESIPTTPKREMAWTILLSFMDRNRDYFRATAKARDYYLLTHMIEDMRPILVGTGNISDESFTVYTANVIGVIQCWIKFGHYDKELIDYYVKKLMQLRFMRF